jgi:hypothetical protein
VSHHVHLVHGIGQEKGAGSVDLFARSLADTGLHVHNDDYVHSGLWAQRSQQALDENAEQLGRSISPGDHVIAHSNGCRVTHRAAQLGVVFGVVYLFAPAMSAKAAWPAHCAKHIRVIHNRHDWAVRAGSALIFHPFGPMGAKGYQGPKPRGFRIESTSAAERNTHDLYNHSHYTRDPAARDMWMAEFLEDLQRYG